MNLSAKVTIPTQVMAREVGDETVILDLVSGTYYGLDPVGARIWQLISTGDTLTHVFEKMLEEYEVSRDLLEQDINRLVEELAGKGLITLSS